MEVSWNNLPSVVLLEVFSYLTHNDKVQASLTCKHWRYALFHPIFWQDAHFHFVTKTYDVYNISRTKFLTSCFAKKLRKLTITYDSTDLLSVQEAIKVLQKICGNVHVRWLLVEPSHCTLKFPVKSKKVECAKYLKSRLLGPLLRLVEQSYSLEYLSLGCSSELADNVKQLLDLLQQHQSSSLQRLALASVKYYNEFEMLDLDTACFSSFQNLQLLTLDYNYVSDSLLSSLEKVGGLLRFVIHVHRVDRTHPGTSNTSWASFTQQNPDCELRLNLISSPDGIDLLHSHILKRAMPLTHLKMLFCSTINFTALHMLNDWYDKIFRSLWLVESIVRSIPGQMEEGPDPLVMLAYKCKKLEEIVILGHEYHYYDLVGIARMRGESLKLFDVSSKNVCLESLEDSPNHCTISLEAIESEISSAMKQDWSFLRPDQLHDAVNSKRGQKVHRNEYVIPLMQLDHHL